MCQGGAVRVAIVEDDIHVGQLMTLWLEEAGHTGRLYTNGKDFLREISRETFDLLIFDWMLPDTTGDKLLMWVREHLDQPVPVIFVTARDTEEDIVRGLNLGADDYITKPVRRNEFLARVAAVMRRTQSRAPESASIEISSYHIDLNLRTVRRGQEEVELTQKEFELAVFLFRNLGRLLSRQHLLESVWGHQGGMNTRTVDTHVSRLRTKLDFSPANGLRLSAIYNHGYRLEQIEPTNANA